MRVTALIPHWNRRELLQALLENLERQRRRFDQVLVVDNGSTDGSAEMAEQSGARVLRIQENRGFAYAVNRGVEETDAEWVAILNNDVTLEPDWLEVLLKAAQEHDAWFLTGKIVRARDPRVIDATFDEVSRGACAWRCGAGRLDAPVWNEPQKIRIAPMTAALVRRKLFEEIGPLDETFESHLEDVDFGLRAACAGRYGRYQPKAVARHIGSATSGEWNKDTVRRIARNQVLLAKKHFRGSAIWPILAGQLLWGFVACRHGRGWSYLRGKLQGLAARPARPQSIDWRTVKALLEESEQHILELQQAAGYDSYWRAYFWLSRR